MGRSWVPGKSGAEQKNEIDPQVTRIKKGPVMAKQATKQWSGGEKGTRRPHCLAILMAVLYEMYIAIGNILLIKIFGSVVMGMFSYSIFFFFNKE